MSERERGSTSAYVVIRRACVVVAMTATRRKKQTGSFGGNPFQQHAFVKRKRNDMMMTTSSAAPMTIKEEGKKKKEVKKEEIADEEKPSEMDASPFPKFKAPDVSACWAARDFMAAELGEPKRELVVRQPKKDEEQMREDEHFGNVHVGGDANCWTEEYAKRSVLDSVVGTILSQNTTDLTSARAMRKLKRSFSSWEEVRTADADKVEEAIKEGGLAKTKTARIQSMLDTIVKERGECSLEYLWDLSTDDVKKELGRFKGIGPKTMSCVLMFCLQRPEFPVDTHVWKIAKTLKWVPQSASREDTYLHLNSRVPDAAKYDLHVLLVDWGKKYKNDATALRRGMEDILAQVKLADPDAHAKADAKMATSIAKATAASTPAAIDRRRLPTAKLESSSSDS